MPVQGELQVKPSWALCAGRPFSAQQSARAGSLGAGGFLQRGPCVWIFLVNQEAAKTDVGKNRLSTPVTSYILQS